MARSSPGSGEPQSSRPESHCGLHATGRSAAFWLESYGGRRVALLSAASHDFLQNPPADFSGLSFLRTRGALHLTLDELPKLPPSVETRVVERLELELLVPGIRPKWRRALFEPGCADIDVAALHAAFLRRFRASGGVIATDSRLEFGNLHRRPMASAASRRFDDFSGRARQCRGRMGRSCGESLRRRSAWNYAQTPDHGAAPHRAVRTSRSAARR